MSIEWNAVDGSGSRLTQARGLRIDPKKPEGCTCSFDVLGESGSAAQSIDEGNSAQQRAERVVIHRQPGQRSLQHHSSQALLHCVAQHLH